MTNHETCAVLSLFHNNIGSPGTGGAEGVAVPSFEASPIIARMQVDDLECKNCSGAVVQPAFDCDTSRLGSCMKATRAEVGTSTD